MTGTLRREAEGEAARLPALLAQALPLAATVRAGAHARRREGAGTEFWSYRPYRAGDEPRRIDWRRSARGDEVLVREHEQARAATVRIWPDRRPGMRWRSDPSLPLKSERAAVLALALASLLGRGGERVGLLGASRPAAGVQAADRLAEALAGAPEDSGPATGDRRGALVLITDALEPAEGWAARLGTRPMLPLQGELSDRHGLTEGASAGEAERAAPSGASRHLPLWGRSGGLLLRIIDPAELDPPYAGRTLFTPPAGADERLFGRAEAVRADYRAAFRAHAAAVDAVFASAGFRVLEHRTDRPAATALLALWRAIAVEG